MHEDYLPVIDAANAERGHARAISSIVGCRNASLATRSSPSLTKVRSTSETAGRAPTRRSCKSTLWGKRQSGEPIDTGGAECTVNGASGTSETGVMAETQEQEQGSGWAVPGAMLRICGTACLPAAADQQGQGTQLCLLPCTRVRLRPVTVIMWWMTSYLREMR